MSNHDKHGALKALDNFYDQLSATEPRRALLKLYDHARQLARAVDELSARSATVPIDLKKLSALIGTAELHLMGWRNSGGGYANTEDVIQRLRAAEKELESARTETAPTEGIPYVATLKFNHGTREIRGTLSDADIATICQLDGCRAQRAEERRTFSTPPHAAPGASPEKCKTEGK